MEKVTDARFSSTQWTLVYKAIRGEGEVSRKAMTQLCESYWPPLYVFARRKGLSPTDAEDAVQGLFGKLVEHEWLDRADESKGRLRTFFLTLLERHIAGEWRKEYAAKRGGGVAPISMDQSHAEEWYGSEQTDMMTPDALFDRRWALTLLEQTVTELESDYAKKGQAKRFATLRDYLGWNEGPESYEEVAKSLGMTAGAVKLAVYRLRKKYREILMRQIADTLETREEEAVREELQHMLNLFS